MSGRDSLIHLIRHGEAAAGWGVDPDPGLSDLGQQQSGQIANELDAFGSETLTVYSSPLRRALETAQPLAERLSIPVHVDATFRELPSPVPLMQRSDWLRAFMTETWSDQNPEIQAWKDAAIQRLRVADGVVAIFTHFVVINAVVAHITGNPKTHCFTPANGSITTLESTAGVLSLRSLGKERESVVN